MKVDPNMVRHLENFPSGAEWPGGKGDINLCEQCGPCDPGNCRGFLCHRSRFTVEANEFISYLNQNLDNTCFDQPTPYDALLLIPEVRKYIQWRAKLEANRILRAAAKLSAIKSVIDPGEFTPEAIIARAMIESQREVNKERFQ
jgi:hypothetical protein